jgi:2-polyprenyl-6-methoxyphenol hydroxylase-like FAD-dependent oxidoreductase
MRYSIPGEDSSYDVIVIGGALSGAATATLRLRQNPSLRLLIIEKSAQLTRRVGETTVEVISTLEANKRSQYVTARQPKHSGRAGLSTHPALRRCWPGNRVHRFTLLPGHPRFYPLSAQKCYLCLEPDVLPMS